MGFWEKLFGKKNKAEESDGQEKYFKDEYKAIKKVEEKQPDAIKKSPAPVSKTTKETSSVPASKSAKEKTPATKAKKDNSQAKKPVAKEKVTTKSAATTKKEAEIVDDSPEVKESATVQESKATANGKFDIRRSKDGRFFFSLYSSNGAVVAYSQIYSSITAVNTGINSVIANATKAEIEDTTLKKPVSLPCPKWEIYIDKAEQYRFRLYAINGQCVCHSSHGYASKSGCKGGIDSIRRFAKEARVDKSYLK